MEGKKSSRFELETFHRDVSDKDLVSDLVRVSRELGKKKITFRDYNVHGKYSSSTIAVRFGSWNGVLEKSGLEKTIERNISIEALFRNIVDVWTKLGRQPKFRDLSSQVSAYSSATYASRFGGWRDALCEFVNWANDQDVPMGSREKLELKSRKTPRDVNWRLRAQVLMRDSAKCRLCGAAPADGARLHVDHIKPWSKGGETIIENLQILCETCNVGKGSL